MAKEQVLVVDDQPASRELVVNNALIAHGYRALVAQDAAQAAQQAADSDLDLVILNDASPGLNGLDVLESLRQLEVTCPALVVLAAETTQFDVRAFRLGVKGAIREPLTTENVQAAVERALQPDRVRRERDRMAERPQDRIEVQKRLYTIGQAIAAQADHQLVCNRLVEAAVYVASADEAYLFLHDTSSGEMRLKAQMVQHQQAAQAVDSAVQDPLIRRAFLSGSPHLLFGPAAAAANAPAPALMDVLLKSRERHTGVLRVLRLADDSPFTAIEYHELSVLISYAALALENAELIAGIQNAMEHVALGQISTFFGSTLHIEEVLNLVMDVAARIMDADLGYVVLHDERTGRYEPRVSHAFELRTLDDLWFVPAKQIVQRVLAEREPILTVTKRIPLEDGTDIQPRSSLCVPMQGNSDVIGAIYMERSDLEHGFTEHHRSMLASLSVNAAVALENARLFHQVEAERRKLDAVLRGTDQPMIVMDLEGTVLLMNRAAHRAFSTVGKRGTGYLFSHMVEHPGLANLVKQARLSERVQHDEITVEGDRTFSATVTPIPDLGTVVVMQDITEIKKLSQIKSEFVATVSHDLRSPLSTVQGFLSVLDQAGPVTTQQADFITSAQREVMRLFDLTKSLLDLGKLDSGIDLEMHACDLKDVVNQATVIWQVAAQERGHTLTAHLPPRQVFVHGSAILLRQVLDNLLSNATKYTMPGGQISVQLARVGHEAVLQVKDSGIGIETKDQPYVFDRFFRASNEYTYDIEGTGLGLAIVRGIVERHGGRVWLESEYGRGTTIGVVLPIEE